MVLRRGRRSPASGAEVVSVPDGEWVVRRGDTSREMYIIVAGRVEISRAGPQGRHVLAVLERGDFFGEMSLLEGLPRDADARALGATTLQVVRAGDLVLRLRQDPTLALDMLQRLSGRVRALNAAVAPDDAVEAR